ncbi:MAG TPA: response regulator [Usitatibacter sp.]|nr:response regulator [Usitatibacter sp.]
MKATRKILVVDDDPVVGASINRVLSPKGFAVISASDGQEALDRIAKEDYDVVYTDIKMPGMSGLEVARKVKQSRPWMPVVIITGYGSADNELEAREIGTAGFLRKPLAPDVIEGSLYRAIDSAAAQAAEAAVPAAPAAEPAKAASPAAWRFVKNTVLFLASPFIGLAYVLVFPFVGLGLVAYMGFRALTGKEKQAGG